MRDKVIARLEYATGNTAARLRGTMIRLGAKVVNVRTAHEKAGSKYWFDVTPSFFSSVDAFAYACGSEEVVYVIPSARLRELTANASLGGQKQVPNFTIYVDSHQLIPAGSGGAGLPVREFLNAFHHLK